MSSGATSRAAAGSGPFYSQRMKFAASLQNHTAVVLIFTKQEMFLCCFHFWWNLSRRVFYLLDERIGVRTAQISFLLLNVRQRLRLPRLHSEKGSHSSAIVIHIRDRFGRVFQVSLLLWSSAGFKRTLTVRAGRVHDSCPVAWMC